MNKKSFKNFPSPPLPGKLQNFPGLVSKMLPRPNHGEESYKGNQRLSGKKALITGGDSGIGRAITIAYVREGAEVVINYLPEEESDVQELKQMLSSEGKKIITIPGDITEEIFCQKLVNRAVKIMGGLDILVNNAARQKYVENITNLSTSDFDKTFKTNVYAVFWLTKTAIKYLKSGSSIINTASVQANNPSPILLDYAQTKAALVAFTKSLAKQLAKYNIRVNAVAPGPYWTPLQCSGGQPVEKLINFGSQTPFGRPGQPVEIAPLYVTLATEESSYVSGQIWGSDGGSGFF